MNLRSLLIGKEPDEQTKNDMAAYEDIQRENLTTPVKAPTITSGGDIVNAIKNGEGFMGKLGGGLSSLLQYANTGEGKTILAGIVPQGQAQGMLNQADIQKQKEASLINNAREMESKRQGNISEFLKNKETNANELNKSTNPKILELLGAEQERAFNKPHKEIESAKNIAETNAIPSRTALEKKKEADELARFNAEQSQRSEMESFKNRSLLSKGLGMIGIENKLSAYQVTPSGVSYRIK